MARVGRRQALTKMRNEDDSRKCRQKLGGGFGASPGGQVPARTNPPAWSFVCGMDIAGRRLLAQHLVTPALATPADVVRTLGAVQAQDYSGAKWGLGMRMREGTDAAIERAFAEGSILRTHVLRPTWHFVTPADIRWLLALTGPRVKQAMMHYDRRLELDEPLYRRSRNVIVRALRDGNHLTRTELRREIERARIEIAGTQRLAHVIARHELDAVICSGPRRGKQFTYALLDERVPAAPSLTRDEALLELTTRYFTTRGPATANDFSWWSGLTVADAKRGIEVAGTSLEREDIDGRTYWSVVGESRRRIRGPLAHLLPNYDEYFIGFRDRSAITRRGGASDLVKGGTVLTPHVAVIDGQIVGAWKRTIAPSELVIEMRLVVKASASERKALERASRDYARFLGLTAKLRATEVAR